MDRIELFTVIVLFSVCCGALYRCFAGLARTVARLERQIDLVMKHSDLDVADLADLEVTTMLQAGRKNEAIKVYEEYTGVSLDIATRHVDGRLGQIR